MTILALLSAATEISHGDPGAPSTGNVTPFRTIKVFYPRPVDASSTELTTSSDAESALWALAARYPLPPQLAPALQSLGPKSSQPWRFSTRLSEEPTSWAEGKAKDSSAGRTAIASC